MVSIEIIGNIGADAKKVDANGSEFVSFNVCDNRKVGDTETSMWYGCALNRCSPNLMKYLVKGQQVFVRGIPRFRIFDSALHHCKMVAVDVIVNELHLVCYSPKEENQTSVENNETEPKSSEEESDTKVKTSKRKSKTEDLPF